jgi:hypothetical protein
MGIGSPTQVGIRRPVPNTSDYRVQRSPRDLAGGVGDVTAGGVLSCYTQM